MLQPVTTLRTIPTARWSRKRWRVWCCCSSPIVPHICHVLWHQLGQQSAVIDAVWPKADAEARVADIVTLIVQVNGKLRARIELPADASADEAEAMALDNDNVQRFIDGKEIRKVIVVPGKLVNVVV